MQYNKLLFIVFVLIGLSCQDIFPIETPQVPTLKEIAAREVAQKMLNRWNTAWEQQGTFAAALEAANQVAVAAPGIRELVAQQLFELKQADLLQLLLKQPIKVIKNDDSVFSFEFDPQGEFLAYTTTGKISFWDVDRFGPSVPSKDITLPDGLDSLAFTKSGDFLAAYGENSIKLYKRVKDNARRSHFTHLKDISGDFGFPEEFGDPQEKFALASSFEGVEGKLNVINLEIGGFKELLSGEYSHYKGKFTPAGDLVVSGSNELRFFKREELSQEEPRSDIVTLPTGINFAEVDPTNKLVAGAMVDGSIVVVNLETKAIIKTLNGNLGYITHLSFSPDGRFLVASFDDRKIRVWDTENFAVKVLTGGHGGSVTAALFNPEGTLLVSTGDDETICFWNIKKTPSLITSITGHDPLIAGVKFYPKKYLFGGIKGGAFACGGTAVGGNLRLFFLPNAQTFTLDQLFFLLAIIRLEQDSELSAKKHAALKQELKVHPLFNLFDQKTPWLRTFIDQIIDSVVFPVKPLVRGETKIDEINITEQDTFELVSFKEIIEKNSKDGKATIIARVHYTDDPKPRFSYYNAYNLLKHFYGDNFMNPAHYRKTDEPNKGILEMRVREFGIRAAKDPNTNVEIGTRVIEFYIINNIADPAFNYLGDDHTLYDPVTQRQSVRAIFEGNQPDN